MNINLMNDKVCKFDKSSGRQNIGVLVDGQGNV